MKDRISINNNSLDPIKTKDYTIWAKATVNDSFIGKGCNIGDFSNMLNCTLKGNIQISRGNFIRDSLLGKYTGSGRYTQICNTSIGKYYPISWRDIIGVPEHNYKRITSHSFIVES